MMPPAGRVTDLPGRPCFGYSVVGTTQVAENAMDTRDYEALAIFRAALRKFLIFAESSAQASGISSQAYQVLLAIRGRSPQSISIGELADSLLIKHHSAVGLANRLQAQGLVT